MKAPGAERPRERTKFKLRRMRRADLDRVFQLEQRIFPRPWTRKSYEFELEQNPASEQWVIEAGMGNEDAQVVAYSVCWYLGDEVHIANLAVAPKFRRLGLGRRLLSHALTRAAEKGMQSATLEVRISNRAAQALYERFGFHEVGRRKSYYSDNREDALLMQLPHLDREDLAAEQAAHKEEA
ncbi:MAG: ribosomal protein S18-alanine N-acetyltransferase [Anaerolineales bacterium]